MNFGNSIGRRGLSAPGEGITSLGTNGKAVPSAGSSIAAPFVIGALALVWSEFPDASAGQVRVAVTQAHLRRRPTIIPPLLNAWAIFATMRELRSTYLK
jgi:subtilisin family serine protease